MPSKGGLRVRSDYALSKRWAVTPSEVSQYRRNRLRFPFAVVLDIADVMDIDPIEIIGRFEYTRCRERDRECVKRAYFKAIAHISFILTIRLISTVKNGSSDSSHNDTFCPIVERFTESETLQAGFGKGFCCDPNV
nr:hypothetical protein [Neisseria meningitidis]